MSRQKASGNIGKWTDLAATAGRSKGSVAASDLAVTAAGTKYAAGFVNGPYGVMVLCRV